MKDDPNNVLTWTRCFVQPSTLTIIDMVHPVTGLSQIYQHSLAEIQARYPGALIGDFEEWWRRKEESFIAAPKVITEERYMEMLEVLPPMRWIQRDGSSTFMLSEMTCGRITMIFCYTAGQFFELSDRVTLKHEEIVTKCRMAAGLQPDPKVAALVSAAAEATEKYSDDELEGGQP
jgi:hypothetical protein